VVHNANEVNQGCNRDFFSQEQKQLHSLVGNPCRRARAVLALVLEWDEVGTVFNNPLSCLYMLYKLRSTRPLLL
jgi:hypothetical protein